jgi:hypothetical protein
MSTITALLALARTPRAILMLDPTAVGDWPETRDAPTVICDSCKYLTVVREVFC